MDFSISVGLLGICLAITSAVALAGLVAAFILLRDHMRVERRSAELEVEVERLQDKVFNLSDSEERHRTLIDAQGDLIQRSGADGHLTYVNEAYARLARRPREHLLGSKPPFIVHETTEPVRRPDGSRAIDECIETPDGRRWVSWIETIIAADDSSTELLRVGRDVTERVRTEQELEDARARAEAANGAKSRFLAVVSHEIRTPLNGILGMADLLSDTKLNAEQATYVRAVKSSGEALLSLIDEILDFSKIEAGKFEMAVEPFDLHALVEGVVELLAPRAQGKGIEIAASMARGVPTRVVGDADRLRQVLVNLAGNAVKFTQKGGVGISVARGTAGRIIVTVSDTGPGIPSDRLPLIFKEFERVDGTAASRHEGVGLGLAISRRIVERMQGTISVSSKLDQGSVFQVTLPLPDVDRDVAEPEARPDLSRIIALVVSRSPFEVPFLADRLDEAGATVERVGSVAAAENRLMEGGFNLLIADCALGEAATKRLAAAARSAGVERTLVLLSPFERREFGSPSESGFDGYLVKPVRPRSLFSRLLNLTRRSAKLSEPLVRLQGSKRGKSKAMLNSLRPTRVLIAEDNEINQLLVRKVVEKLGGEADCVGDGEEAVARIASSLAGLRAPYDIALLDVRMPGVDGLEAARLIRQLEAENGTPRLRLVAVTANAFKEDREAAEAAGFDAFIPKPIDRDKLSALIESAAEESPRQARSA